MCEDVELRNDRKCFRRHAHDTTEAVYEIMSLFIIILFVFFFIVTLTDCLLAFYVFPKLLTDVALLRLRP